MLFAWIRAAQSICEEQICDLLADVGAPGPAPALVWLDITPCPPSLHTSLAPRPTPSLPCCHPAGFGGPYCEGRLQRIMISDSSPNFDSGPVALLPGQWVYYNINTMT